MASLDAFCRAGFCRSVCVRRMRSNNNSCCRCQALSTWQLEASGGVQVGLKRMRNLLMTTHLITGIHWLRFKGGGLQSTWKHRPPSWIVYLQGPHPRHRFQSPELTRNNNNRSKKHKSISQQHHTTNTQAWKEASTNCTQLINLKTWLVAEKLTHCISLALISKHTGGQGSGSLRMLGEELNQQGSLCRLHTQKPLAARSPIGLTCAHFQRNGTYSWIS